LSAQESIGSRLKRERDKKNFSIEDVHLRLRIHPGVIQRLEKDDLNDWPGGKIYARGFLKQYADFLGLNTAEILSEFDSLGIAERPVELFVGLEKQREGETVEAPKPRKPRAEKKREPSLTVPAQPDLVSHLEPRAEAGPPPQIPVKLILAIGAIVLMILAVIQISSSVKNWAANRPSLKAAVMAPIEKKIKTAEVAPAAVKPARPAPKPVGKPVAPTPSPAAAAVETSSRYLNSPAQGSYPKIRPQDRMMLEVYAVTDVWMRIQADGQVVFEAILHRGETERWLADKGFDAKLGRPEGVRIAVNGYSVGQPGAGKVKNLRFSRDGIEEIKG
jgi:cytoskeleton protein RodZ